MPTFPYSQTSEVYSVPPPGGIPMNPTGYRRSDGSVRGNRDLLGNVVDPAMEPDMGVGAQPPRDPYMASLPPRQPTAPGAPPVTTLQPGRTTPFSRADAQALAALDPRALDEAKAIAAMPESTPAKMTGAFGGKSFEMQPSARVDRNALARLYAQAQERKGQERQDAVRGQEQAGKERIVSIPGEQAAKRREMELGTEERITGKKLEADAPARAADIEAKRAQTAATTGAETRAQAQADAEAARRPSPAQEALERRLEAMRENPIQTAETRAQMEELERQVLAGRGVAPEQAAAAARGAGGPVPDIGEATAEILADPGMAAIIARAKETTPGMFTGNQGRGTGAAARLLAERAIRARLARIGASPEDIQAAITSILGAQGGSRASTGASALTSLLPPMLQPGVRMAAGAMGAAQ